MKDQVISVVANSTGIEALFLKENSNAKNLWDSFSKVEIVLNLETEFGVQLSDEDLSGMNSVDEIVSILASKASK